MKEHNFYHCQPLWGGTIFNTFEPSCKELPLPYTLYCTSYYEAIHCVEHLHNMWSATHHAIPCTIMYFRQGVQCWDSSYILLKPRLGVEPRVYTTYYTLLSHYTLKENTNISLHIFSFTNTHTHLGN